MRILMIVLLLLVIVGLYCWWCWLPHKELPCRNKKRILCIGDSITFGAGVCALRWKDSYPAILYCLLGNQYQVLNYGISGATMQYLSDNPYSQKYMDTARNTGADICIVILGTNDSKPNNWNAEEFEKSLTKRISEIQSFPTSPDIYLLFPPAAFGDPVPFEIRDDIIREEICPILHRYGQQHNVKIIDLYSLTKDHPEWFSDGVHPNKRGNMEIARTIAPYIMRKCGDRNEK